MDEENGRAEFQNRCFVVAKDCLLTSKLGAKNNPVNANKFTDCFYCQNDIFICFFLKCLYWNSYNTIQVFSNFSVTKIPTPLSILN